LKESDISEMKNYKDPPKDLVLVLDAVALLNGKQAGFDNHKKMINNPKSFINDLKSFKKEEIKEGTLKKLKKFIKDPAFTPENIRKKSVAGESICMWVIAMDKFSEINKIVVPKRKALAEANESLAKVEKELKTKQEEVRKIKAEKNRLEAEYQES
jgi:dynein heavy chain